MYRRPALASFLPLIPVISMLIAHPATAQPTALPPDEDYVTARGDALMLRGQRVRFWGAIGNFPGPRFEKDGDPYAGQRLTVQRLKDMGFNMVRFWHYGNQTYTKGDGSARDRVDFFLAECARQGVYIWAAGLGGGHIYQDELADLPDPLNQPDTIDAWKQAIGSMMKVHWWSNNKKAMASQYEMVSVWDERLEAQVFDDMKKRAEHLNRHNGLRYADDPVNAVWELTNEQWWMSKMTRGAWVKLPEYFRRSLIARWHGYLRDKYRDDAALTQAWGFLMPGESIDRGTVLLAPMGTPGKPATFNDTNPNALAAFEGVAQPVGRDDFTAARGRDVLEFLTGLLIAHKQRFADRLKGWGKSCRLSPLIFDTGIGENIQSQYMHQQADAVSHAAYMEGVYESLDPADRSYPFYSILERYPRISNDVPWLEHNRYPGKPYLVYETQMGNPSKYRAEFPMRLVALGAIQDWSAVCFHYWTIGNYDFSRPEFAQGPLSKPGPGAHQYDYTFDQLAFAARRTAGEVFKRGLLKPAANPTTFVFGPDSLYDPVSMSYGRAYGPEGLDNMLTTTYRHGVRLVIDPAAQKDEIKGPVVRMKGFNLPTLLRPTDQITFDTVRSELVFDAPGVAAYVGFFARHGSDTLRFANGVVLRGITFLNPPDSPYPVTDEEKYFNFALVSTDSDKPLAEARSMLLTLVSTSFNSGLKLDPANKNNAWGQAPVLVTRVGATVESPAIDGTRYVMRDFYFRSLAEGVVRNGTLTIPADLPIFCVEITRP